MNKLSLEKSYDVFTDEILRKIIKPQYDVFFDENKGNYKSYTSIYIKEKESWINNIKKEITKNNKIPKIIKENLNNILDTINNNKDLFVNFNIFYINLLKNIKNPLNYDLTNLEKINNKNLKIDNNYILDNLYKGNVNIILNDNEINIPELHKHIQKISSLKNLINNLDKNLEDQIKTSLNDLNVYKRKNLITDKEIINNTNVSEYLLQKNKKIKDMNYKPENNLGF